MESSAKCCLLMLIVVSLISESFGELSKFDNVTKEISKARETCSKKSFVLLRESTDPSPTSFRTGHILDGQYHHDCREESVDDLLKKEEDLFKEYKKGILVLEDSKKFCYAWRSYEKTRNRCQGVDYKFTNSTIKPPSYSKYFCCDDKCDPKAKGCISDVRKVQDKTIKFQMPVSVTKENKGEKILSKFASYGSRLSQIKKVKGDCLDNGYFLYKVVGNGTKSKDVDYCFTGSPTALIAQLATPIKTKTCECPDQKHFESPSYVVAIATKEQICFPGCPASNSTEPFKDWTCQTLSTECKLDL